MDDDMLGGGGGGFMADDDMDGSGGGGFFPSADPTTTHEPEAQPTSHLYQNYLPLTSLPEVFTSLDLQWDDDVLETFKGMYIPAEGGERERLGVGADYASKKDFRAVCAVMMEPEAEPTVRRGDSEDEDEEEDAYQQDVDEDMDMDADADADEEMNDAPPLSEDDLSLSDRPPKKGKSKSTKKTQDLRLDPAERAVKLSKEQRAWVGMMWNTMFEGEGPSIIKQYGPRVLGKEQIKRWSVLLEQNWSDVEVCLTMSA